MEVFNRIIFWLKAARAHTIPMSIMSWLVVFCWSYSIGGDFFYGVLALIGIIFAQLGVNLIDDCFDYKKEIAKCKSPEEVKNIKMQDSKCQYLIDGKTTLKNAFIVSFIYFGIASVIGLTLLILCGWQVALITIIAGLLCIFYPFLTYMYLGEVAVFMTFAPLLFAGVSFVMLGYFTQEILLISIPTGLLTVGLLHTHALLDFDLDIKNNKKTLCTFLGSKNKSLMALAIMMTVAYINIIICIFLNILPLATLATFITIPLAVALYKIIKLSIENPEFVPKRKLWMGPMENWEELKKINAHSFTLKIYLARNLMMFFTILLCIGLLIGD